ncbi:MAG: hypothetical protein JWR37_2889 [Mycobacterium sp.]|jgi:predicted RNA-binding Zn-ribbon protein involved in translation (DUF1610 family)|nr:hypothetical protein [Mycobacterium sp.]
MLAFIAAMAVVAVAAGTALGWVLRSVTSWCPDCGEHLRCSACDRRPGLGAALNKAAARDSARPTIPGGAVKIPVPGVTGSGKLP